MWKQTKDPLTDEWIAKCGIYIYAMEYYSTTKRTGVLIHATTWMNLENITLS